MGGQRDLYQGYALQGIDRKGRVAIPAGLRAAIENNSGERLILIGDHDRHPCMIGYDRGWSRLLYDRLERDYERARDAGEAIDRSDDGLHNFANVDEVAFDESGRFILPQFVRDTAGLDDLAFFAGSGDTFQIWNPQRLMEAEGVRPGTRERCAWAMKQRGIA